MPPRPASLLPPGTTHSCSLLPRSEEQPRPTWHPAEAASIYFLWQLRKTLGLEIGIPQALLLNYILEMEGSLCIIQKRTVLPLMALKHAKSEQDVLSLRIDYRGLQRSQCASRSPAGAEPHLQRRKYSIRLGAGESGETSRG